MRTLTRRSLMAGALAVLCPATQYPVAYAEEDEAKLLTVGPDGSVRFDPNAIEKNEQPAETDSVALGQAIADFGLAYVGYPYVAGGNSPAGFDCSGFTQWVVLNVLGIDIGHALEGQPAAGPWVEWGVWAPGDLVFFQNTYKPGLSHDGIYIGDGLMVHAANESTGVLVSSFYSDYYAPRYWGACRLV